MIAEDLLFTLLLRGGLITLVAWIVSILFLRRARASVLRILWMSVFVVLLILPLTLERAQWDLPVPSSVPAFEPSAMDGVPIETSQTESTPAPSSTSLSLPSVLSIWTVGFLGIVLFLFVGHVLLYRLYRSAPKADASWSNDCEEISAEFKLKRTPAVLVVEDISVPTTAGILRPSLLIPPDALEYSDQGRRATLLHELTHVRGRDPLFIMLAQFAVALHWINPLAWLGLRAFRMAQERHCDDAAILSQNAPANYADLLVRIASRGRNQFPTSAGLALSMANHQSSLSRRVHLILDTTMKRNALSKKQTITLTSFILGLILPLTLIGIGTTEIQANPPETPTTFETVPTREGPSSYQNFLQELINDIKISQIAFTDQTLEDCIDYLRDVAKKESGHTINFVILSGDSAKTEDLERLRKELQRQTHNLHAARTYLFEIQKNFDLIDGDDGGVATANEMRNELEKSILKLKTIQSLSVAELATIPEGEFVMKSYGMHPNTRQRSPDDDTTQSERIIAEKRDQYISTLVKKNQIAELAYKKLREAIIKREEGSYRYKDAKIEVERITGIIGELKERLNAAEWEKSMPQPTNKVTLELRNISLASAVKYVAEQAGVQVKVDSEAIVLSPNRQVDFGG